MSSNECNYEASYKGRNRVTIREEDQNVAVRSAPCQFSFELTTVTGNTRNHGDINMGVGRWGKGWDCSTWELSLPDRTALHI